MSSPVIVIASSSSDRNDSFNQSSEETKVISFPYSLLTKLHHSPFQGRKNEVYFRKLKIAKIGNGNIQRTCTNYQNSKIFKGLIK